MGKSKSNTSKQAGEETPESSTTPTPTRQKSPSSGHSSKEDHVSAAEMQRLRSQVVDMQNKLGKYEVMFKTRDMSPEYDDFKNETNTVLNEIDRKLELLIIEQKSITEKQNIIEKEHEKQYKIFDEMDQDRRYPCLLLHGVEDPMSAHDSATREKAFRILREKMQNININDYDISEAIRLGKYDAAARTKTGAPKPRPILIRFTRRWVRRDVWKAKANFKGSGMMITESLTPRRLALLNTARKRAGDWNAWSQNGDIYIKKNDGQKQKISCAADIDTYYPLIKN